MNAEPIPQVMSDTQDFNPPPPVQDDAAKSSDEILKEIGQQLRKRREMLSLTYEEVEHHTRVRALFLKALEDGALEDMPSPVQTRGILPITRHFSTWMQIRSSCSSQMGCKPAIARGSRKNLLVAGHA